MTTNGSKSSGCPSRTVAKGSGGREGSYETKSRGDKQSGSHRRSATKEETRSTTVTKGYKSSGSSSRPVAVISCVSSVPMKITLSLEGAKGGGRGDGSHETKSRSDGKGRSTTGAKSTARELQLNGTREIKSEHKKISMERIRDQNGYIKEVYKEERARNSGRTSEYKKSSTEKIGDQGGYTKVYKEERVRNGGQKSEYKKSATVRIGDQSGYTEFYKEERVRNVSFQNGGGNKLGNLYLR